MTLFRMASKLARYVVPPTQSVHTLHQDKHFAFQTVGPPEIGLVFGAHTQRESTYLPLNIAELNSVLSCQPQHSARFQVLLKGHVV